MHAGTDAGWMRSPLWGIALSLPPVGLLLLLAAPGADVHWEHHPSMLNTYVRVVIPPIVREHGGEIDSLIGDAIEALVGVLGAESGRSYPSETP